AMTLLDAGIETLGCRAEVLGTDVSTRALERAKTGVYPPRALLNVPRDRMERYFEPTALGHRVKPALRDVVAFRYQNLVKEPFPTALMGGWDVIFCRNVTIYFRIESTRRVVDNLFESLNPGGYLFIGHSETLTGITDRFETVEAGGVFLHRKPARSVRVSFPELAQRRMRRPEGEKGTRLPDVAALLDAAGAAITAGRSCEALDAARTVLDAAPANAEAHLLAARAFADDGDFDAAIASAQEALRVNPLLASARYVLGLIHLREGRLDGAMAEFRRTVYTDGSFVLAHLNLGNLHRARGDYGNACRSYEHALRALENDPDGPWTAFLGGFEHQLLAATCARSLELCARRAVSA
ncbi:MAG TPA: CheR family methyltransferase, partial [Coriobacteriia bacterium]|nr:CheR family methyltransferase [Coriobacteriia bacterium]